MSDKEIVWMNESRKRIHEKSLHCLETTKKYEDYILYLNELKK
jgi:hypothetical protein